ncbi:hypothetical protein Tco_1013584 [Tanacetum coccineum]
MPLVPRTPGGSSSAAGAEVSVLVEERLEDVVADDAYLEFVDPGEDTIVARRSEEEVVTEQPKKIKKKRLKKRSDVLPAKKLRTGYPSLASGTGGKTLAGLEQIMPICTTVGRYCATTTTSTKAKLATNVNPDLVGPSQLEESEGSDDSFYELATLDPSEAKRWYVPRWNITNDSLLDDGFLCITRVESQLAEKEAEAAEVVRLYDQVSSLSEEKSA